MRRGQVIKFDSKGQYPQCDNRYYRIIGNYRGDNNCKNIQEIDPDTWKDLDKEHTQVIVNFTDGPNKFIEVVSC